MVHPDIRKLPEDMRNKILKAVQSARPGRPGIFIMTEKQYKIFEEAEK